MRRERMTSKTARCVAMVASAQPFLTAHLPALAQSAEPAQLHDAAAMHPAPIPPNLLMANAQALKCQPARLVSLLRKHDMPDVGMHP